MLSVWILVGLAVGMSYALTGVGGAIIGMPLFIHLGHYSMREATEVSLITVAIGSVINLWIHRQNVQWKDGFVISLVASVFSHPSRWIKDLSPPWALKALFLVVCGVSLYKVVFTGRFAKATHDNTPTTHSPQFRGVLIGMVGCLQGFLITMTGLGGGIILIPILLGPMNYSPARAVATTVLATSVAALGSMAAQWNRVNAFFDTPLPLALALTILVSSVLTQAVLKKIPDKTVGIFRSAFYTFIIVISIIGVALS